LAPFQHGKFSILVHTLFRVLTSQNTGESTLEPKKKKEMTVKNRISDVSCKYNSTAIATKKEKEKKVLKEPSEQRQEPQDSHQRKQPSEQPKKQPVQNNSQQKNGEVNATELRPSKDRQRSDLASSGDAKGKSAHCTSTPTHTNYNKQAQQRPQQDSPHRPSNNTQPQPPSSTPKSKRESYTPAKQAHGYAPPNRYFGDKTPTRFANQQPPRSNYNPKNNSNNNNNNKLLSASGGGAKSTPFKSNEQYQKKKQLGAASPGRILVENHFRNKVSGYAFL
jgi:hypothetical protein